MEKQGYIIFYTLNGKSNDGIITAESAQSAVDALREMIPTVVINIVAKIERDWK